MKTRTKLSIGAGMAALFAGMTMAGAADMPGKHGPRMGHGKIFTQFDLDKDGKVTAAEVDQVVKQRFEKAGGGSALSEQQFASIKGEWKGRGERQGRMFQRIDWNGDGQVSRDEFVSANRIRFSMMDRGATGEVSCAPKDEAKEGKRGFRKFRAAGFCAQFDLDKDGKVTRAEFDQASGQTFDAHAQNGAMTQEAFKAIAAEKAASFKSKRFAKLDTDKDGKLSLSELETPAKALFTRLDANKDGAVTKDEIRTRLHHRKHGRDHDKTGAQTPG